MTATDAARRANLLLPATGLAALWVFVVACVWDRPLYERLVDLWSFHVAEQPFTDLAGPLSWLRCWRDGVDVFLPNACELHSLPICYSPILLRLPLPWVGEESTPVYALIMECLYLVSLAMLPTARRKADAVPMFLILFSPLCVFALERANLDLLIFALVAACVLCVERGLKWRVVGYALILIAGLLKFYPWVLLLLLFRERRTVFFLLSAIAAACISLFVLVYYHEILRVLGNMPQPVFADDAFGARQTINGLAFIAHSLHTTAGTISAADIAVWEISAVGLYTLAGIGGLRLARLGVLTSAIDLLTPRESLCLFVGAALLCGSYFTGVSVGYRSVYLLFAVPGLLAMARAAAAPRLAGFLRLTVAASVVLVWSLPIQRAIIAVFGRFWRPADMAAHAFGTPFPGMAFWVLREALWWWLMTVLLAVTIQMVARGRFWTGQGTGTARTPATGWTPAAG